MVQSEGVWKSGERAMWECVQTRGAIGKGYRTQEKVKRGREGRGDPAPGPQESCR